MPRTDRGVAQRYAAKKRKKRTSANRPSSAIAEPIRSIEGLEDATPRQMAAPLPRPESRQPVVTGRTAPAARPRFASRRPFSSYAEEYRYVLGDLRRVALVAGSLLLCLIVLSFVIR